MQLRTEFPRIKGFAWFSIFIYVCVYCNLVVRVHVCSLRVTLDLTISDMHKEADWRIESTVQAQAAFASAINNNYYASNTFGSISGLILPI